LHGLVKKRQSRVAFAVTRHLRGWASDAMTNPLAGDFNADALRHGTGPAEWQWVYDRLFRAVARVNALWFRYNLTGDTDNGAVQFTEYSGSADGAQRHHYGWHTDVGISGRPGLRKLSVTVQLSDPTDYDDGHLQFNAGEVATATRARGTAIFFPSYALHRVTPVTRGTRFSLVGWYLGRSAFE
jgi:PKHD-type hydroxylase